MQHNVHPAAYIIAFLSGFFLYAMFEIALRGSTHWTMGLLGGINMTVLCSMRRFLHAPMPVCAAYGMLFATASEFTCGVFDNLIMGWHVWDYSGMPFHILGQICPLFSGIWFLLCLAGLHVCNAIRLQYQK
ncbi:MAG TPA: hypothetical protein DCG49_05425 [Ruminococcus sp.]|nr:hypothetical protein [Ruminococcus sp.]